MEYDGEVDFVGVTFSNSDDATLDFVEQYSLSFPIIADRSAQLFINYDVPMTPLFVLLTSVDGEESLEELTSARALTAAIDEALM